MPKSHLYFTFFLISLLLGSCTRNDDQIAFEQEAYRGPANYTETTSQGEALSVDDNDWRTAPLFQGLIDIEPPFPNPTNTTLYIQFIVGVTGVQSVSGLDVLTRFEDGSFRSLYQNFETLEPGETTFQINPMELSRFGDVDGARGLHRIYIFNGNQQMISYGDVMVE